MFSIVNQNAIGTVHSFVRGFDSADSAHHYAERYHHCGVGRYVIRSEDEDKVRTILANDPLARRETWLEFNKLCVWAD